MGFGRTKAARETLGEHPTVTRVDALLATCVELGASDLHVGPGPGTQEGSPLDGGIAPARVAVGGGMALARVDGFFREIARLSDDDVPRVVARLKVLAGLPAFRTSEPQDGRLRVATPRGPCDARIATVPVPGGEKVVVRFLDLGGPRGLDDLGLAPLARARVDALASLADGAVVVVGPCSSGKSTTLRAMARAIVAGRGACTHVATAEDPVEQLLTGVTQVEVDAARGLDFPRVLAALLRQDPQVLVVGEMRDPETARIGVEAALTGHLVLTSLHVARAEDVSRRLELLGVAPALVAAALRGIVNQRLVRRACAACTGTGCETCGGTGHRGRFALAEVATCDGGAPHLVTPSLDDAARAAVASGTTTAREVRRVLGSDPVGERS